MQKTIRLIHDSYYTYIQVCICVFMQERGGGEKERELAHVTRIYTASISTKEEKEGDMRNKRKAQR